MIDKRIVILIIAVVIIVGFLVVVNAGKDQDRENHEVVEEEIQVIDTVKREDETEEIEKEKVSERPETIKTVKTIKEEPVRDKAPDFVLEGIAGEKVRLSDHKGKVIIIDFWDTWCAPCKTEIPGFVKLQKEWGDKGVQIIGIAFAKQGVNAVKTFAENYKINYPIGICDEGTYNSYGPIAGIPTTFIIDKKGRIYEEYVGYRPEEVFVNDIKNLISE